MFVTDVGVNTVNGDTLVKMQTLEAPKTALDIAIDNLCDFISKWGTIAAVLAFIVMTVSGIMNVGGFGSYFSGDILEIVQKIAQNFANALTIIVAAMTARFATLCIMAVFNGFLIRTDSINLFKGIGKNKLFIYIAIGIFVMTFLLCNVVGSFVQTTVLSLYQWGIVFGLPFCIVIDILVARLIEKTMINKK